MVFMYSNVLGNEDEPWLELGSLKSSRLAEEYVEVGSRH